MPAVSPGGESSKARSSRKRWPCVWLLLASTATGQERRDGCPGRGRRHRRRRRPLSRALGSARARSSPSPRRGSAGCSPRPASRPPTATTACPRASGASFASASTRTTAARTPSAPAGSATRYFEPHVADRIFKEMARGRGLAPRPLPPPIRGRDPWRRPRERGGARGPRERPAGRGAGQGRGRRHGPRRRPREGGGRLRPGPRGRRGIRRERRDRRLERHRPGPDLVRDPEGLRPRSRPDDPAARGLRPGRVRLLLDQLLPGCHAREADRRRAQDARLRAAAGRQVPAQLAEPRQRHVPERRRAGRSRPGRRPSRPRRRARCASSTSSSRAGLPEPGPRRRRVSDRGPPAVHPVPPRRAAPARPRPIDGARHRRSRSGRATRSTAPASRWGTTRSTTTTSATRRRPSTCGSSPCRPSRSRSGRSSRSGGRPRRGRQGDLRQQRGQRHDAPAAGRAADGASRRRPGRARRAPGPRAEGRPRARRPAGAARGAAPSSCRTSTCPRTTPSSHASSASA